MIDRFGRRIKGLRLSLTSRCNMNCIYCHNEGQGKNKHEMSTEECKKIIDVCSQLGMKEVKISGGEPLLRDDITEIIEFASVKMEDVSLTTNGVFLGKHAKNLEDAGLNRINVSLDTLNAEIYKKITGTNHLNDVINNLKKIANTNIKPIKLNMVIMKGINDDEIEAMMRFSAENDIILQIIELVPHSISLKKYAMSLNEIERHISSIAIKKWRRSMHGRMKYIVPIEDMKCEVEFVRPLHNTEFCMHCTRIRINSDGKVIPCIMRYDEGIDILRYINSHKWINDAKKEIWKVVEKRVPYNKGLKLKVKLYFTHRDALGRDEIEIYMPRNSTVKDAYEIICRNNPSMRNLKTLFALNCEYVNENKGIDDGDTLAIFPPVSGG